MLADVVALGREDNLSDPLRKDLEEGKGVVYTADFDGDADPTAEGTPLFPGRGVLLTDRGRKPMEIAWR